MDKQNVHNDKRDECDERDELDLVQVVKVLIKRKWLIVAGTIPISSISAGEANPTAAANATSMIMGKNASRRAGESRLESVTPSKTAIKSTRSRGKITAPAETGPAHAPRPASSNPAM